MNFREALEHDLTSTFFEECEFASLVKYNDKELLAILDESSEVLDSASKNAFQNASALGLYSHDTTLYVQEKDLLHEPIPGEQVYINGFAYRVSESSKAVSKQDGIYKILLTKVYS